MCNSETNNPIAENNKLIYKVGDETKPKIEIIDKNVIDKSIAKDVYKKAFKLVDVIIESMYDDKTNYKSRDSDIDLSYQSKNNIIAFIGGRGTGKTSSMLSVYKTLVTNRNIENTNYRYGNFKITGLNVIDPTYFEENSNILEIIIANMFSKFKAETKSPNKYNDYDLIENRKKLVEAFQIVKKCMDAIENGAKWSTSDSIESLSALANGVNLKTAMHTLISEYLKYMGYSVLVIAIDDIDLQTKYAYKMVEQIRRYLIIPRVVILMGVKMELLTDIVKQSIQNEYRGLIDADKLMDTLENMAGRYLSKLIPYNHRIHMPDIDDLNTTELQIEGNNGSFKFKTITEGILRLIFIKASYMFYDSDIKHSLIIPRNLRDLLSLISMIYEMETPKIHDNEVDNIILEQNRTIFRNYFIQTWCSDHLPANMYIFIRDLWDKEPVVINKEIVNYINNLVIKEIDISKANLDDYVINVMNKGYNVSLADMYYILDKVSSSNIPYIKRFGFAIKTIYSMMLCRYEHIYDSENDLKLASEKLLKRLVQDSSQTSSILKSLRKSNKLMIYSNYEKLLGGNFIRIGDLPNVEANASDLFKVVKIHKEAMSKSLNDLFDELANSTKEEPMDDMSFKVLEYIILTTYMQGDNLNYRLLDSCYYDNPKFEYDDKFIFCSSSILFNAIKIRHYNCLYEIFNKSLDENITIAKNKYSTLNTVNPNLTEEEEKKIADIKNNIETAEKLKSDYQSTVFYKFFNAIKNRDEDKSLINKILKSDINKRIGIELRNIEIFDSLVDYLDMPVSCSSNIDDFLAANIKFIEQLSKFDYYIYTKVDIENNYENNIGPRRFAAFDDIAKWLQEVKDEECPQNGQSENSKTLLRNIFSLKNN